MKSEKKVTTKENRKRKYRLAKVESKKLEVKGKVNTVNHWGCSVCGLESWCGTDGCPLDPT